MEKKSLLEKAAGNTLTTSSVALMAAASGSFIAPLLPIFIGKLATDRYCKRLEKALEEINSELEKHEEKINQLTDAQFKFINEGVTAILSSTNDQKIEYLKRAVLNSIDTERLKDDNVIILSRVLRDISVEEMKFLIKIRGYERVIVSGYDKVEKSYEQVITYRGDDNKNEDEKEEKQKVYHINPNEAQEISLLTGLVNLGVLAISGSGFGGTINYKILPIAHMLISLILENNNQ